MRCSELFTHSENIWVVRRQFEWLVARSTAGYILAHKGKGRFAQTRALPIMSIT